MMNEKFYRYTTTCGRKVINKFEKIHQSDGKYKLFYKYINALLKEDLKKIDSNSFKYQNVNKRIPFRFWIMWWQGIDNNTPEIISKNIKNIKNILAIKNAMKYKRLHSIFVFIILGEYYEEYIYIVAIL